MYKNTATPWPKEQDAVTPLRGYQELVFQHQLANERCNCWVFMGGGKTRATLEMLNYLYGCGFESRPTLVLAPLRVARSVWPAEARKWKHLDLEVSAIVGTEAERLRALKRDAPVYSINYENLPWLTNKLRGKWPFGAVVADESTKLKGHRLNSGGLRAGALAKVAHQTPRWINLTGTPSPNGLIDLWGQQWFVDQGARIGAGDAGIGGAQMTQPTEAVQLRRPFIGWRIEFERRAAVADHHLAGECEPA